MKKRIVAFFLMGALSLSLAACGSQEQSSGDTAAEDDSTAEEETGITDSSEEEETADSSGEETAEAADASEEETAEAADIMVYKNGNIYTSDEEQSYVSAIVVQDGKFLYVGDDEGAAEYEEGLPEENIVDLDGALVTAGLIEGHTHFSFMAAMKSLNYVEIPSTANESAETALAELKKFVEEHPDYDQYVMGNFSQTFDIGAKEIDEICSDKPVILVGMGLHCGYVNSKFLEVGGIDKDSTDAIPGQTYYERDEDGNPTGKIVELTQTWIAFQQAIKIDDEKLYDAYLEMIDLYHSYGFTGVAEGGFLGLDEYQILDTLTELEENGDLNMVDCPATIWYGHTVTDLEEVEERLVTQKETYTSDLIHPGTLKMWADGTLGAHSALLREPYVDKDTCGVYLNTVEDLTAAAEMCKENDMNIHYHAIGDQAIENVLTAYEAVGETSGTKSIVHFQISAPDLIERASEIDGLIVNMTPIWANTVTPEEVDPVSDRRDIYGLYKEASDAGITINFGADSNGKASAWNPATMILISMYRNPDEEGAFLKGQPFSFEEAVDAYTINVAKERRIEDEYGSLEVGKSADFVIWNTDDFSKDNLKAMMSYMGGRTDTPAVFASEVYFKGALVYKAEE